MGTVLARVAVVAGGRFSFSVPREFGRVLLLVLVLSFFEKRVLRRVLVA
jgi:hypothetical protein